MVQIKLFAYLRANRGKHIEVEYSEGMRILDVINTLGIKQEEVQFCLAVGKSVELDYVVSDNEVISIWPPICGG